VIVLWPSGVKYQGGAFQFTKSRNKYIVSWSGEMIGDVTFSKTKDPKVDYWNSSQPKSRVDQGVALLLTYLLAGGNEKDNL